jgi:hypothetical protein
MVRPGGGRLVIDHYAFNFRLAAPWPFGEIKPLYRKYLQLSRLTTGQKLLLVRRWVGFFFPLHWRFRNNISIQRVLRRISPVIFHFPLINLRSYENHYQWSLLDTHDALTDAYKHLRTAKSIRRNLMKLDRAYDINVSLGGNGIEAYCDKN